MKQINRTIEFMRRESKMVESYLRKLSSIFLFVRFSYCANATFGQSVREGDRRQLEGEVVAYYLALLDTPYAVDPYSYAWPVDILIVRVNEDSNPNGKSQFIKIISGYRRTDSSEFKKGNMFEFSLVRRSACDDWGNASKIKTVSYIEPKTVPLGKRLPCYIADNAGKVNQSEK